MSKYQIPPHFGNHSCHTGRHDTYETDSAAVTVISIIIYLNVSQDILLPLLVSVSVSVCEHAIWHTHHSTHKVDTGICDGALRG